MKAILRETRGRRGQWWVLRVRGAKKVLSWSLCSTRREARELRDEIQGTSPAFNAIEIVHVTEIILDTKK